MKIFYRFYLFLFLTAFLSPIFVFATSKPFDEQLINSDDQIYSDHKVEHTSLDMVRCRSEVADVLANLPSHVFSKMSLTVTVNPTSQSTYFGDSLSIGCSQSDKKIHLDTLHELGHAIYDHILSDAERRVFENRASVYDESGKPNYVTNYALTSPSEDFADTFMITTVSIVPNSQRLSLQLFKKFTVVKNLNSGNRS